MEYKLRLTGKQFSVLRAHLYPGDACESVALVLCGRHITDDRHIFLMHEVHLIKNENCILRTKNNVQWSTQGLEELLNIAEKKGMALLKIHSHPSNYNDFSVTDDASDKDLFESVHGWLDDDLPHASVVMLPDGSMFGRAIAHDNSFTDILNVTVVGDDIKYWGHENSSLAEYTIRTQQTFGKRTTQIMSGLTAVVVGCSGTGGPLIEMLVRNNIGKLILVDPKLMELKNLNRIPNTKMHDVLNRTAKVQALKQSIEEMGLGTEVIALHELVDSVAVLKILACADILFGCVDSISGRDILNSLATHYLIPYFDLGVRLDADGEGGINQIFGTVHYLQPGGSSLKSRKVYTPEQLHTELLKQNDPKAFNKQKIAGYLAAVDEDSPAVISVNTQMAAFAMNEFLARLHPYRDDPNSEYAIHRYSFNQGEIYKEHDGTPDLNLAKYVGRGLMRPFLNMPRLS